jgi:hypothetical protein
LIRQLARARKCQLPFPTSWAIRHEIDKSSNIFGREYLVAITASIQFERIYCLMGNPVFVLLTLREKRHPHRNQIVFQIRQGSQCTR